MYYAYITCVYPPGKEVNYRFRFEKTEENSRLLCPRTVY